MATKVNINGKLISRPGVYTLIKSGIKNEPARLDYGNVVIIDDGLGAGFGGGKSLQVYDFERVEDLRNFVKGGELWNLAQPLFKPLKGNLGVSKVSLIHARTATSATITFDIAAGDVVFTTVDEGLNANGTVVSGNLTKGFAGKMVAGSVADTYKFQIWHGSFKGVDSLNNTPYDNISEANARPILILESPEVSSLAELKTWADSSSEVKAGFKTVVVPSTGDIVPADLTANASYVVATGGTETYNPADFTAALEKVKTVDNTFFLSLKANANAQHANNLAILSEVIENSKYEKFLIVAGGSNNAEFESVSIPAAVNYDSDKVILVHGDGKKTINGGFKRVSSLWKAANVLGRLCGLEPQTPLTYKQLDIDAEFEELSEVQQEKALSKGVLVSFIDTELGYDVVLQGINTLQLNNNLVNEDASSHDIGIKRITAQLNKEVAIYLKRKFFGKASVGPNRNTITAEDIKAAVEGFLQSRIASSLDDNLILRFDNISVSTVQDTYYVSYEFVPNYPVNKIIVTGIILEN